MIPYQQALHLIRQQARQAAAITTALADGAGKFAAQDVTAPFPLPAFDNSAMDGFALRHGDGATATPQHPVILPVCRIAAAGDAPVILEPHSAIHIMTGAPIPACADAVIPIEKVTTTRDDTGAVAAIALTTPPEKQQHIRSQGADLQTGDMVIKAGDWLTPQHIMALAALGIGAIMTRAAPEIVILATGSELSAAGTTKNPSSIYDASSPYLLAMCRQAGLTGTGHGIVGDTPDGFAAALRKIAAVPSPSPRIIISTGAVSKGEFDFLPQALRNLQAEIIFHRVAVKPGQPVLFARLPNGDYLFGLPGNPVSTAAAFRFVVAPLLREILGLPPEPPIRALLREAYHGQSSLRQFLKAHLTITPAGQAQAAILPRQESFHISSFAQANGWIMLPENAPSPAAGELVDFVPAALWSDLP